MLKIKDTTITMTRGDSAHIELALEYEDGSPYVAEFGDCIRFTVREKYTDQEPKFIIDIEVPYDDAAEIHEVESVELYIKPSHTRDLPYGQYKYDVQMLRLNGDIDTFIDRASLVLTEEVGLYTDTHGGGV